MKTTSAPVAEKATYTDIVVESLGTKFVPSLNKTKLHFQLNGELKTAWSYEGETIVCPSGTKTVVTVCEKNGQTYYNV